MLGEGTEIMENAKMRKTKESVGKSRSNSLFRMNKKGQVADILGGFQRVISWFIDVVPRPVKMLIFLLFILALGAVFSFFLNATGNWCDTAGNEYTTGFVSIFTNIDLLTNMPSNDDLDTDELNPNDKPFFDRSVLKCSFYADTFENYIIKYENGTQKYLNESQYFFHDTGRCTYCEESVTLWVEGQGLFKEDYCIDDILYPKPYDERSWSGKTFCGSFLGSCEVPEGYYYDRTRDLFICDDDLCKTINGTVSTIGEKWNLMLRNKGAKLKAPSPYGDKDYRNAISVECDAGDVNPKWRLFGIEILSYKLWVFLFVLSALVWALFKLKR